MPSLLSRRIRTKVNKREQEVLLEDTTLRNVDEESGCESVCPGEMEFMCGCYYFMCVNFPNECEMERINCKLKTSKEC